MKPEGKKYGTEIVIRSPTQWPPSFLIEKYYEPIVKGTIITPAIYLGSLLGLISDFRQGI
jgi:translation elongation factor EF-4